MGNKRNIATIIFLLAIILLAGNRYAHAQNSSANPFIDSRHLYRIAMANTGNTPQWELFENDMGHPADITINGSQLWAVANIVGSNAEIVIKFDHLIFDSGDKWFLVYSETNASTGNCIARRSFEINLVVNSFFLSLPVDDTICNAYSGSLWANTIAVISADEYVSSVAFTVNMTKDATFLIDKWRFTGLITFPSGATNLAASPFSVSGSSTSGGNWVITDNGGGNFTLEVTLVPPDFNGLTDAVTFDVNVEGDVTQDFQIKLAISNGQAESGTSYVAITDDNLNLGGGDREVIRTIRGVPDTPLVTISP